MELQGRKSEVFVTILKFPLAEYFAAFRECETSAFPKTDLCEKRIRMLAAFLWQPHVEAQRVSNAAQLVNISLCQRLSVEKQPLVELQASTV